VRCEIGFQKREETHFVPATQGGARASLALRLLSRRPSRTSVGLAPLTFVANVKGEP
jgi:hypothetical protein